MYSEAMPDCSLIFFCRSDIVIRSDDNSNCISQNMLNSILSLMIPTSPLWTMTDPLEEGPYQMQRVYVLMNLRSFSRFLQVVIQDKAFLFLLILKLSQSILIILEIAYLSYPKVFLVSKYNSSVFSSFFDRLLNLKRHLCFSFSNYSSHFVFFYPLFS